MAEPVTSALEIFTQEKDAPQSSFNHGPARSVSRQRVIHFARQPWESQLIPHLLMSVLTAVATAAPSASPQHSAKCLLPVASEIGCDSYRVTLAVQRLGTADSLTGPAQLVRGQQVRTITTKRVSHVPACSGCTIEIARSVTIRPPTDLFWFGPSSTLLKHSSGYLGLGMGGTNIPQVFDLTGRHVRELMRRGAGPGEATGPVLRAAISKGDSVFVYASSPAPGSTRRLVFSPNLEFVRTESVQIPAGFGFLLSEDGRGVVQLNASTRDMAGQPLHIIDARGTVTRSFGRSDPEIPPNITSLARLRLTERELIKGGDNTFWSWQATDPVVERWNFDGQLLARIAFGFDGWYTETARKLGWSPTDSVSLIWFGLLESREPNIVWLAHTIITDPAAPRNSSGIRRGGADLVLEALDVTSGCILASRRLTGFRRFRQVANGADVLAVTVDMNDDFSAVDIYTISLKRTGGVQNASCTPR